MGIAKPQRRLNQYIKGARENPYKTDPYKGQSKQSKSEKGKYH
jgi:hypothetical protein